MSGIFDSYDLSIDELAGLYRKLNESIRFPDGMVTSLGSLYRGREEHAISLVDAIPRLRAEGIHRLSELLHAIRTPRLISEFAQHTEIPTELLRILKHDIELWLPRPVSLTAIEPLQKYSQHWRVFADAGIRNQLQMISRGKSPRSRALLAEQTSIPLEVVEDIVKTCDAYRLGSNVKHLRTHIYYDMGLDTWQKWASSSSEEIIERFREYVKQHDLEAVRLVPWPKEVRNGIEWAKQHLRIFEVEW